MRVEHLRFEHVGAGVDQVARLRARRRLLDEAHDPSVGVAFDDAERRRVVDADQMDRRLGARRRDGRRPVRRRRGRSGRRRWRRRTCRRCRRGRRRSGSHRPCRAARARSRSRSATPPHRPSGKASTNGSGRKPSASVTPVDATRARGGGSAARCSGTWAIGSIDFGTMLVNGRRRVPNPPTRTTACISRSSAASRAGRGGRRSAHPWRRQSG